MKYRYTTTNFIGETSRGIPNPVFWDPHTQIANNRPGGVLITGAPGGGKTNLAMTLGAQSAIMGKDTVIVDWKGDFLKYKALEQELGKVRIWALGQGGSKGSLDPFNMTDDDQEKIQLVMDVLGMFIGGATNEDIRQLSPIVEDVIRDKKHPASLSSVLAMLRGSPNAHARSLGAQLNLISKMNYAQICFAPAGEKRPVLRFDGGTTVATLYGLDLPTDQATALDDNSGRLASGIFYLLTYYIRSLMKQTVSNRPKTLIIDEAWAILATAAGSKIVKEVSLLGRSKKTAMILATQNYDHLANLDIDNTIATHFAFRAEHAEAVRIIQGLNLSQGEGFQDLVTDLEIGECLMRDWRSKYSTVEIKNWRQDWATAFNTNPYA